MSNPEVMDVDASAAASDSEDDPITASYPVFLNPSLPLGRRLLVLQHPNRTDDAPRPPPSELRIKEQSGMVEVDVPLDYNAAYDREKGVRWGRVLQSSMAAKNGGSHGLAGGFGFGAVQQRGGGGNSRKKSEVDADDLIDWNDAVRQDKVLRTQTLGGQYPEADEVQHMVGVFQGNNLHLTPASSLIHLRPQLHHLDATTQAERQSTAAGSKEAAGGAANSSAARAIHMTIKTTADGETVATETIADRLRSVQGENWRKMRYTDENEEAAWEVYNESMFLTPTSQGGAGAASGADDGRPLEEAVPTYGVKWENTQLLEAVSGIKKPPPTSLSADAAVVVEDDKAKQEAKAKQPVAAPETPTPEEPRRPRRAPRGGASISRRSSSKAK